MRLLLLLAVSAAAVHIDPKGYVVYCPCMGRFGNQMDQALGAIAFARDLDRTLVLPPFLEYNNIAKADTVAWEDLFQVKPLEQLLRVIPMKQFMRDIAPVVWPKGERRALCWSPRQAFNDKDAPPGCQAKDGNPFGPFWDAAGVEFDGDEYFGDIPGGYELSATGAYKAWIDKFPPSSHPVLAFSSAPAAFPSQHKNWHTAKYFRWTSRIQGKARQFISDHLQRPYVGIHLRNDVDWVRVCEHVDGKREELFASAQCMSEYGGGEEGQSRLTREMCAPCKKTVVEQVAGLVGRSGARSVFVASDKDHMIDELNAALKPYDVVAVRQPAKDENAYVSLAILQLADEFIGNCISTFSAIVSRQREYGREGRRPNHFWAYETDEQRKMSRQDKIEL